MLRMSSLPSSRSVCTGERIWWLKKKKDRSIWKNEKLAKASYEIWCPRQRSWRSISLGAARRKLWWLNPRRSEPLWYHVELRNMIVLILGSVITMSLLGCLYSNTKFGD
jgi:hypothetical protein